MELLIIAVFQFDITLTDRAHTFTARETSGFLLPAISRARSPTTNALDIMQQHFKVHKDTPHCLQKKKKQQSGMVSLY